MNLKAVFNLFKQAARDWTRDQAAMLAAALAYYTVFSLAPLLVISVAVASLVLSEETIQNNLTGLVERNVSLETAEIVRGIIDSADLATSGVIATTISIILGLVGATGVFGQLRRALNTVWGVPIDTTQGIMAEVRTRLLAFAMVLIIGFLLLLSVLVSTTVAGMNRYLAAIMPDIGPFLPTVDLVVSLVTTTLLFAALFKILPDVGIAWRDVWLGAMVTAVLFTLGKYLIYLFLTQVRIGAVYGTAGSLIVILAWIYYSAWIFLYGAEFTQVYANRYGSKITLSERALEIRMKQYQEMAPKLQAHHADHHAEAQPKLYDPVQRQFERRVGYVLLGLAAGLFVAFISRRGSS